MSIALLGQVYDDLRRIAVAGSAVAPGDFRLKKHIAPLEAVGAKAPVFAKVAEQVKALVDSTEKSAPAAVLELASLLSAVLYTQGETAVPGALEPIDTVELDLIGQTSARTLKPLLEALSNTGSGRMELIKDAFERGAFKDLRLVKPSLAALDDGYAEIAEFIAGKVLPLYGRAILPELRAKFDPKGKAGNARRLQLMHKLDPAGARETVKAVLDVGSKEVRVAAIGCLGIEPEDLTFLLDQAEGKAHDVRGAAYLALAGIDDPAAVAVLQKAMTKDVSAVLPALEICKLPVVWRKLIVTIQSLVDELKTADRKTISAYVNRAQQLLTGLWKRDDHRVDDFLLKLFSERSMIEKYKGDTDSGTDLNRSVTAGMLRAGPRVKVTLAAAHAALPPEELADAFCAARIVWPAEKVLKDFTPYLASAGKKDSKKREAVLNALNSHVNHRHWIGHWIVAETDRELPPLHPGWLDAVVAVGDLDSIITLGRPGHAAQNAFLRKAFDEKLRSKHPHESHSVVAAMVKVKHPDATDCLIAAMEKAEKKSHWYSYQLEWLIPDLPAEAIPKLEALVPKLVDRDADRWLDRIEQLRAKHRTPHG